MGHSMEVKSSLLHQSHELAEDKTFTSRASRGLKPREEDKTSQFYQQNVVPQQIDGKPLFFPKFSCYYQKPWPNKLPIEAEELVKHMSNIPGYLQRKEKGDSLQEKALNFGVLGWQRLERWTDKHRRGTVNEKVDISPASSGGSSASSTFGLSSKCCTGSSCKHGAYRNQFSYSHQDSSTEENYKLVSEEEEVSRYTTGYHSPEIERSKCQCHISGSAGQCLHMDNLASKLEENKKKILDPQAVSYNVRQFSGASTLQPRSLDSAASHSINEKLRTLEAISDCREKCDNSSLSTNMNCPLDHQSELSHLNDAMLDHSREIQGSHRFSFGSAESAYTLQTESDRTSFVGTFSSEEFQLSTAKVPHSCPLTSDVYRSEWSDVNVGASEHGEESDGSCCLSNSPPQSGALATAREDGWHERHDKSVIKSHTPENCSSNVGKRVTKTGRELLHDSLHSHAGLSNMIRNSRTREASARWKSISNGHNGQKESDISKARRSPLRRLLDPLLKPKACNSTHTAKLAAGSPRWLPCEIKVSKLEELPSTCELWSSAQVSTHSCGGNSVNGVTSSTSVPMGNHTSAHNEKHEASRKRTLLQLAWKNGSPLFTFSVDESDILAATRKKGNPGNKDSEYIYTIFTVCETKKKTGSWINQGTKSKRKELGSTIVGQINVSCIRGRKNRVAMREFVLLGPELRPSVHGTLEPLLNNELAAIVIKDPEENAECFIGDLTQKNDGRDPSKINLQIEKNAPKMVAILPSEVHGLSDSGKPSPLVDRWKSRGLCDCGGWDAGCSLTILTNNLQDGSPSVPSFQNTEDTHRVELVIQGMDQESTPAVSLVVFKEGLYMVEFHASIAPLQAFAVCIASLHSKST